MDVEKDKGKDAASRVLWEERDPEKRRGLVGSR